MAAYIDRAALTEQLRTIMTRYFAQGRVDVAKDYNWAITVLDSAPAADVAEVVHGQWIDGAEDFTCGNHNAECSICRCYVSWDGCDEDFNYCPNCGAKMDGGNDNVSD